MGYPDSTYKISKRNFNPRHRNTNKTVVTPGRSSEKGGIKVTMPQAAEYIITSDLNLSEQGDHSEWDNCTINVYEL
jgi:hypothetical protein